MNKQLIALLAVFSILGSIALPGLAGTAMNRASFARANPAAAPKFVPGEVLVKFKTADHVAVGQKSLMAAHGVQKFDKVSDEGLQRVKLGVGKSVEQSVIDMASDSTVEYVQPNYIYTIAAAPNDPSYGQQWALKNTGQTITSASYGVNNPGTAGVDLGLETAWNTVNDCSSVIVAVLDTGINYNHTDLAANMWSDNALFPLHGANFIDNNNDPMDNSVEGGGHGTHVAGIIGAIGNNGIGTAGVCWKAKIMAVKVFDQLGSGTSASVAAGIDFARTNNAKVMNMSFIFTAAANAADPSMQTAVGKAVAAGIVMVAAAGNSAADNDATQVFPCNFTGVLCVAATDQANAIATFSNFGATKVAIGAPGTNILSPINGTHATGTVDDFSTGWTLPSPWGRQTGVATLGNIISVPATWNFAAGPAYTDAAAVRGDSFKTFDLSAASNATWNFGAVVDTEAGGDRVFFFQKKGTGNPTIGGVDDGELSGAVAQLSYSVSLKDCSSALCTLGVIWFNNGNSTAAKKGVAISNFQINTVAYNSTTSAVFDGTSMASPYVAGVATMLAALHPNYTAADIILAIKSGGTTVAGLATKVSTSKVLNALGAISFINAPVSVRATVR